MATEKRERKLLGDRVEAALTLVGITKERVSNLLGRECHCSERQQKLNELDLWARQVLRRGVRGMRGRLRAMLRGWEDDDD